MNWLSIEDIAFKVQAGELKAVDLVKQSLQAIYDKQEFNAVIAVLSENALKKATEIDLKIASGEKIGRLAGVPFIAKDNFLVFGADSTAASNMLRGFVAPYQATAIELLEQEGAICVAKANLDAFAHGSSTENSDFGVTLHPKDPSKVPGGSSGGSVASVMLDLVPFALGTDTGGSIRQPASFCGAVGYKPSYGLVSRWGVVAMASSTDTVGPITKTVTDAAFVLDVLAGPDVKDATTIPRQSSYYITQKSKIKTQSCKVGVIKEFMAAGLDDEVRLAVNDSIELLKRQGHEVVEVSIPSIELALACYYVIVPAEISSNLSRYDGQRYGYSVQVAANLDDSFKKSRSQGFGLEAKRRIMIGTYVLSSGYYDAYYKKAAKVRTKLIQEFNNAFEKVDFLVGPVTPTTAFNIGENSKDPLQMYLADIMTVAVNLVGVPAVSVPAHVLDMPVGFQIIGQKSHDKELLQFAHNFQEISQ